MILRTGKVHHREFEVKKKSSCFTKDLLTDPNFIFLKGTVILKRCFSEIIVTKKKLFCIFTAVFFGKSFLKIRDFFKKIVFLLPGHLLKVKLLHKYF